MNVFRNCLVYFLSFWEGNCICIRPWKSAIKSRTQKGLSENVFFIQPSKWYKNIWNNSFREVFYYRWVSEGTERSWFLPFLTFGKNEIKKKIYFISFHSIFIFNLLSYASDILALVTLFNFWLKWDKKKIIFHFILFSYLIYYLMHQIY